MPSCLDLNTLDGVTSNPNNFPRNVMPNYTDKDSSNGRCELDGDRWRIQFVPTDSRENWMTNGNRDYNDGMYYNLNKQLFRADDFIPTKNSNKLKIMTAGCSHSFGIGVCDEDVYTSLLCKQYDAINWNISSGGSGNHIITLLIRQFFNLGYIPDVLIVQWSYAHRKLFADSTITSFANPAISLNGPPDTEYNNPIHTKYVKHIKNKISGFKNNNHIDKIAQIESEPIQFTWQPSDTSTVTNSVSYKAGEILAVKDHTLLLEFITQRDYVISLCKQHNIMLKEIFADDVIVSYLCEYVLPFADFTTGDIPMTLETFNNDQARDNQHYGRRTHQNIAKYLSRNINL